MSLPIQSETKFSKCAVFLFSKGKRIDTNKRCYHELQSFSRVTSLRASGVGQGPCKRTQQMFASKGRIGRSGNIWRCATLYETEHPAACTDMNKPTLTFHLEKESY